MPIVTTWIDDERPHQQAAVAVHVLHREHRPPPPAPARRLSGQGESERYHRGQHHVGGDAGRAGRVPVDRVRCQVHTGDTLQRPPPRAVGDGPIVRPQEAAGQAAFVQPVGALVAQQERRLGGDIGIQARGARHRHLLPARLRRPAGDGIDQVVLLPSAAAPGAPSPAAGGKAAGLEPHGAAPGQLHVDRSARGDVAAGGDPALAVEAGKRLVHGTRLDHAVQIELHAGGHAQQLVARLDPVPATCDRRCGRLRPVEAVPEVAVVASRAQGGADRGVDQPAGLVGGPQRQFKHVGERAGDADRPAGAGVHRVQLAAVDKAAEATLVAIEQGANPPRLLGRRPGHAHVAAHRPESQEGRAHDWLVLACGGADWGGAMEPDCSAFCRTVLANRRGAVSGVAACRAWPDAVLRVASIPPANTATAAAARAPLPSAARRLAASIRPG